MGIALRKGENMPILASVAEIRCRWSSFGDVDADLSALLLRGRQVRTDDDFIFYNQAESVDGSVKYLGKRHAGDGFEDRIAINLADVAAAADIDAIAVVLSVDSGHRLVELGAVTATILDAGGTSLATFTMIDLTVETAAVAFEIYRRGVEGTRGGAGLSRRTRGPSKRFRCHGRRRIAVHAQPNGPIPNPDTSRGLEQPAGPRRL